MLFSGDGRRPRREGALRAGPRGHGGGAGPGRNQPDRGGGEPASGHGERSRSQLLFKLGGTENMRILAVNVLAVKFWLLIFGC